ncbi:MAG: TorF family putative porin [Propionivibrio sp.]
MKKTLLATLLVAGFAGSVAAEEAAPPLTANVSLVSSYRFRGIDQTYGKPALQGGFDYAHSSGFYAGNWNSSVSSGAGFPDGNLEMDFYGGYKAGFGDFGIDVGGIYYYYPGSEAENLAPRASSGAVTNKELYVAGSWKFLTLKYSYSVDDYFSLRSSTGKGTDGTGYVELNANYDLGDGWGINGHIGRLNLKNIDNGDYTDWKIGVTKDLNGWVVGLAYVDTNAKGSCSKGQFYCFSKSLQDEGNSLDASSSTKDAGRGIAVLSVSRSF